MSSTPTPSPNESSRAPGLSRALVLGVGAALVVASGVGALWQTRRLDAIESSRSLDAPAVTAWRRRSDGQHGLSLVSAQGVPGRGLLRVRACAATDKVPELLLVVTDSSTRRVLGRERLTRDESLSQRCTTARWRTENGRRVDAELVAKSGPVALPTLGLRMGGAIDPRDLWPALLVVLGVGLLVLAPRISTTPPDDSPRAPRLAGGPYRESASSFPPEGVLPRIMHGYWGCAMAVLALFGVNLAAQAPVLAAGFRGATMLASLVLQQTLLVAVSAAMLGAFTSTSAREALELTKPPDGWARRALVAASLLLALAVGVGFLLKDAGDSPIARAVESMPTRYVIAFGAVCAPLPEELFFRGLLGRVVGTVVGERKALPIIGLSALVFTAMHAMQLGGALLGLVPIAALGLVNGWLRWSTRGLAVPWAVHTFYNGVLALSALA